MDDLECIILEKAMQSQKAKEQTRNKNKWSSLFTEPNE